MSATQSKTGSIRNFKESGERKAQKAAFSPLMETLTRIGYGARGLIYITMGLLAVQVALGKGGALASPQGAIAAIGKQPAGMVLLWVILVGIIAYAFWGVVRAVFDPLDKGHDTKGLLARFGFLVSAFGYAILVCAYLWLYYRRLTNNQRIYPFNLHDHGNALGPLGDRHSWVWVFWQEACTRSIWDSRPISIGNSKPMTLNSRGSKTGYGCRSVWHLGAGSRLCIGGRIDSLRSLPWPIPASPLAWIRPSQP